MLRNKPEQRKDKKANAEAEETQLSTHRGLGGRIKASFLNVLRTSRSQSSASSHADSSMTRAATPVRTAMSVDDAHTISALTVDDSQDVRSKSNKSIHFSSNEGSASGARMEGLWTKVEDGACWVPTTDNHPRATSSSIKQDKDQDKEGLEKSGCNMRNLAEVRAAMTEEQAELVNKGRELGIEVKDAALRAHTGNNDPHGSSIKDNGQGNEGLKKSLSSLTRAEAAITEERTEPEDKIQWLTILSQCCAFFEYLLNILPK